MKRVTHHFTEKQLEKLDKASKDTGLCKSDIVRRALDDYLEKLNKK